MKNNPIKNIVSRQAILISLLVISSFLLSGCQQPNLPKYTAVPGSPLQENYPVVFVVNNQTGEIKGCAFLLNTLRCTTREE